MSTLAVEPDTGRAALCHPDRPHMAHGMCRTCYQRWYRTGEVAANRGRPSKPAIPADPSRLPPRVDGVVQHAFTEWPTACPKCTKATALLRRGREVHCAGMLGGCGYTGYLVDARTEPYRPVDSRRPHVNRDSYLRRLTEEEP